MNVKIKIDKTGFENKIKKLRANAKDLKNPMQTASRLMRHDIQQHFEEEKSDRGRWKSWKGDYRSTTGKILQGSGRLKSSLKPTFGRRFAKIASNVVYAAAHNYGYSPRNLPQRKFMWISKVSLKTIIKFVKRFIIK